MKRYRFQLTGNDPRPVNWPIKHPYWCTGYGDYDCPIIVAYGDNDKYITDNWPDAELPLDGEVVKRYEFSGRFPKPEWFDEVAKP